MRRWSVILLAAAALLSSGARAFEPVAEDAVAEAGVVVSAVPAPAAVTRLLQPAAPKLRATAPAKKLKVASAPPAKSLLSRSERKQLALRESSGRLSAVKLRKFFDDEESGPGVDDLPFHRSFARPRVHDEPKLGDDDDQSLAELPATVGLRLFMARMKALEAQALAAAGDRPDGPELTDEVRLRLFLARNRALEAHRKLHG